MKNAINTEAFTYNEEIRTAKRKELNIGPTSTVIGSVGRLSYQKNSDFIVDIFAKFHERNSKSVLILVGVGDLLDKINEKINQYNLYDCVQLLGSRNDVNEIMMAMDFFLLPSRFEGLPIVMVEAQCVGLPCLVSDTITKEIALSKGAQYISLNKTADEWADILDKTSHDSKRVSGKEIVKNKGYEIDSASKDLEEYYTKILRSKA